MSCVTHVICMDDQEQDAKYVAKAKATISDKRLQNCYCMGLQDFMYVSHVPSVLVVDSNRRLRV
jgi:hypothetical protein